MSEHEGLPTIQQLLDDLRSLYHRDLEDGVHRQIADALDIKFGALEAELATEKEATEFATTCMRKDQAKLERMERVLSLLENAITNAIRSLAMARKVGVSKSARLGVITGVEDQLYATLTAAQKDDLASLPTQQKPTEEGIEEA